MKKGDLIGTGRTAEIFEWGEGKVVKLYMDWCSETWIDHEEEVTRLCYEAGLPAPRTFGLVDVEGRKGLIMDRLEGMTMMQVIDTEFADNPEIFPGFASQIAEIHALLHSITIPGLPFQSDMIRGAIERAKDLPEDLRKPVLEKLDALPGGNVVCHYDLHPGNIMLTPSGPILIDWLTVSMGNPHADIARSLLLMGHGGPPEEVMPRGEFEELRLKFFEAYLDEYSKYRSLDLEELAQWRVPVAAARLNEGIEEQREWLLEIVRDVL